jgi:hypothetical protein
VLNCLKIDYGQHKYWINGADLLQLAQYAVEAIDTAVTLTGNASYDYPCTLDGGIRTWLAVAKEIARSGAQQPMWFEICGRYVKKQPLSYYMIDDGGATPDTARTAKWNRRLRGGPFAPPPNRPIGTPGGPSYRDFSERMDAQWDHSNKRSGTTNETWSEEKARKLRKVLLADPTYARILASKGDGTTGQILPTLAAVMFLAEPSRNIRSFLINKILLDMIATGTTYGGRKSGSSPKKYTWDKVMWRDPHDKGGKLPAAGTGSAQAAAPINPSGCYTQQKELTILCRYMTFNDFQGDTADIPKLTHEGYRRINVTSDPADVKTPDYSQANSVLGYLKYLMTQALHTFAE